MHTKQTIRLLITLIMASVMLAMTVSTASAQRPSLGGLQTQIDAHDAEIGTNQADIATNAAKGLQNMDDITSNSDAICAVAAAAGGGVCESIAFCAGSCTPPPPEGKLVFLTNSDRNGDLGGLAGADAICQSEAGLVGLPGTYKAWLSNLVSSPSTRFTQATIPYVRVDGVQVADNWADVVDDSLDAPINVTANGTVTPGAFVWSGTTGIGTPNLGRAGSAGAGNCDGWTEAGLTSGPGGPDSEFGIAIIGEADLFTSFRWSDQTEFVGGCEDTFFRFYCFEQ